MSNHVLTQENQELSRLININADACDFYGSAQERAESPEIRQTFRDLEDLHRNVILNLQEQVRANGGEAEPDETLTGKAQQLWAELMTTMSSDVDETLVSYLEQAEDRCLHSMENVLIGDKILPTTRFALQEELRTLRRSHDYMKSLKESLVGTA